MYFSTRGSLTPKAVGRVGWRGRQRGERGEPSLSICNDVYCSDINRSGRVVSIGSFSPFSPLYALFLQACLSVYIVFDVKGDICGIYAAPRALLFASGEYMHKCAVRTHTIHTHISRERVEERKAEKERKREGEGEWTRTIRIAAFEKYVLSGKWLSIYMMHFKRICKPRYLLIISRRALFIRAACSKLNEIGKRRWIFAFVNFIYVSSLFVSHRYILACVRVCVCACVRVCVCARVDGSMLCNE